MNRLYIYFLMIFTAFSGLSAYAQEAMTLEKCREMALEHNKLMAIATHNKEKADFTQKSFKANYLPKFSATGNYLYTNVDMSKTISGNYLPTFVPDPATGQLVPNIAAVNPDGSYIFKEYAYFPDMNLSLKLSGTWMAGITAEQPIFTGGKINAAYNMSKIGSKMAELNRNLTRVEVIVNTDEAYWLYVQANEMLNMAMAYEKVIDELLANVQAAEEVGLKHKNDVMKVRVKMNEAQLQVRRAENGVRLSRKNLCHIIGIPLDSDVPLPDISAESFVVDVDPLAGFDSRPEFALLDKKTELLSQQVKLAQSDFLPQVGVMANYGYVNGVKFNDERLFDNASFSALANVSIPLFHWGEGRNKVRVAKVERDIAVLERDDMGEKMQLDLARSIDRCEESQLEVALTKLSLTQAEDNVNLSRDRYEKGLETLADYLEAQAVWQQAWTENIVAKNRQRLNQTYYLKAAGRL